MTTERLYLQGMMPVRFRILCVTLQPLSVAHMMILSAQRNAFVCAGENPQLGDLLHGLNVCSARYPKCLKLGLKGQSATALIIRGLRILINSPGQARNIKQFVKRRFDAFDAYLAHGCQHPQTIGGSGRMPGGGLFHRVKVFLQSEMRMSLDEAMNHPAGAALTDFSIYRELYDFAEVMNEDEQQAARELMEATEKLGDTIDSMIKTGQLHADQGQKWMAI